MSAGGATENSPRFQPWVILANASSPEGAAALDQALTRDHAASPLLDAPHQAITNPNAFNAGGILGHIFGQRKDPIQQGVAKASGIDLQSASKLLMILAPIVMASLARARSAQGANASAGQVLQNEQQHIERFDQYDFQRL